MFDILIRHKGPFNAALGNPIFCLIVSVNKNSNALAYVTRRLIG